MNQVKGSKSVFDPCLSLYFPAFWCHSLLSIFACMIVFNYVFYAFIRIRRQFVSLWTLWSLSRQSQFGWSYLWNVIRLYAWLCQLPLSPWFWYETWRFFFFVSILLLYHVLNRFWMLVFWISVNHFTFMVGTSALIHSALIVCAILRLNKLSRFILFVKTLNWFHSRNIIINA